MTDFPEWILVGLVKRVHGNSGELLIMPLTERVEERFREGAELYMTLKREDERKKVKIESSRMTERGPLVRIEGFASREMASPLFGASLFIPASELAALEPDDYYPFQIEGCEVFAGGRRIGVVASLKETPRANPYLEIDPGGEGPLVLIPFVKEVIRSIDIDGKRIEITEGFLG